MTGDQKRLWKVLVFLLRMMVLAIPLYLVLLLSVDMAPLQEAVAGQSASVLGWMGYEVRLGGYHVSVGTPPDDFYFIINADCTGWKSMLLYFALLFAVPGIGMKKRIAGLLLGIPAIWAGNIARVVGVVLAERSLGIEAALNLHDFAYRIGLVMLVIALWSLWLRLSRKNDNKKGRGIFEGLGRILRRG